LLATAGVERGLIGPGEAARIWDRHLVNCAVVAELVPSAGQLVDLGSGAGLPGIVLAIMLPSVQVVLVEPMARRTTFLAECVDLLGLTNVAVRRGRAEDLAGQMQADVVISRAVASLDKLAVLSAGLARPGGLVLAIKGASVDQELVRAGPVLNRIGATGVDIVRLGSEVLSQPAAVVRFRTSERGPGPAQSHGPAGRDARAARGRESRAARRR
jgi:16S rRNA (guanine527-N7)-methyltransferase